MLLLLEPKKRGFVPQAVRSALQSTEDSCGLKQQLIVFQQ
jgi:hypothetical protein